MKNKNKDSMITFDEFIAGQYQSYPWYVRLKLWFRWQVTNRIRVAFGHPTIQGITLDRGINIRRKGLIIRNCTLMTGNKDMVDIW